MKTVWMCVVMVAVLAVPFVEAAETARVAPKPKPVIELAILLDTSNSMDGLIRQAKTQLWSVVNEFATTKKDGVIPELRVALFEYGNSRLAKKEGYIRMVLPLTDNLDKVSEELFALTTNGGQEYCGQVIGESVAKLAWSKSKDDLKVIFIAGNEPFTQGPVDYRKACKAAIEKGIVVNTIHCGTEAAGISGKWKDGAVLADGRFMIIDQNQTVVAVAAPQDKKIAELNQKLNTTYVPYGAEGGEAARRQDREDANAAKVGGSSARFAAKASVHYRNASWDLVDAIKDGKVKLEDVKEKDLPEAMRKMTVEERTAYVEEQRASRVRIQDEIKKLDAERKTYVAAELKKRGETDNSAGAAMREAVREQAADKNFNLKAK